MSQQKKEHQVEIHEGGVVRFESHPDSLKDSSEDQPKAEAETEHHGGGEAEGAEPAENSEEENADGEQSEDSEPQSEEPKKRSFVDKLLHHGD